MPVKNPKCLVIDTSVMQTAGNQNAIYPQAKNCRDFLIEILKLGHSIIMTDDLWEEWERHGLTTKSFNPKSPAWYATMERKGKVKRVYGNTQLADLRDAIFLVVDSQAVEAVRKDMRLIEAAILADRTVSSHDEKMRGHFHRATPHIEELRTIIWVNPTLESERCIIWLREGCPADMHRHLAYLPTDTE